MSNSDIRVVPGPANYFSHDGSLARLHDFYSDEQLARAIWIYGERAIAGAQRSCRRRFTPSAPKKCCLAGTAAKATSRSWSPKPGMTAPW
jgi:uncharacterized oxidoreductase